MEENLPYWSPELQRRWVSYWALQPSFPNVSLPMYMDMPDIDVYQIHQIDMPEIPDGFNFEWNYEPELGEDGLWYESYKFVPIEETQPE